MQGKY